MTQTKNIAQGTCFNEAAASYLQKKGFAHHEGSDMSGFIELKGTLYFFKDNKGVVVYGDNADFVIYEEENNKGFKRYMAVTGISTMSLVDWILTFHIANIVPLNGIEFMLKKHLL